MRIRHRQSQSDIYGYICIHYICPPIFLFRQSFVDVHLGDAKINRGQTPTDQIAPEEKMISVIVCSADDARFSKTTAHYATLLASVRHEMVRIADAPGMAEGYNRGIATSRGDILIFTHDDIRFLAPDFSRRLLDHLDYCDMLGVAGTTLLVSARWTDAGPPYLYGQVAIFNPAGMIDVEIWGNATRRVDRIQALDGAFLCCRRNVAADLPFDQQTFTGFHLYDLDFSFRAFIGGYRLAVCNDLEALHHSKGNYTSPEWNADTERFIQKHGPKLSKSPVRFMRTAGIAVADLSAVRQVMRPPHWTPETSTDCRGVQ